jgi:hypothetical protein
MIAMRKVFSQQKNSGHSIKQADQVHQLDGNVLSEEILKVVFLNSLSKKYETIRRNSQLSLPK